MLPGKKFTLEDIVRILIRRAWLIVIPLVFGGIAAYFVAKRLPNQYRSETLIMLVAQRVPDSYVKATDTMKIEDRLATLEEQILSRSRLEQIIRSLDLYPSEGKALPMEDAIQRMRSNITFKTEGKESFRVSYVSKDAKIAQQTTERIASLFIEENLRDRETLAVDTNQFLESQLEDAKRQLIEREKKLEEFRSRYSGELPTQETANLQALQNAHLQMQSLAETVDRARERRLLLERQLVDLQLELGPPAIAPSQGGPQAVVSSGTTAEQLQRAQVDLAALLTHDKSDHPDVRAMQRTIRDLEAKLAAERRRPSDPATSDKPLTPAEALRQTRGRDLKAEIDDIDRQLADKQDQDRRLRGAIAEYQAKLDAVPKHESELVELTRDYTTLQQTYQTLLAKRQESEIAANLSRRNIGEQFRVLDPARVPARPFSPNRALVDLGGAGAGFVFGLLLAAFLEFSDSTFKHEEDITRLLDLPVLALVPLIPSDEERRRQKRWSVFGIAAVTTVVSTVALAVWMLNLRF